MEDRALDMKAVAEKARQAYLELLGCSEDDKNKALACVAEALKDGEASIMEANQADLAAADAMVAEGTMNQPLRARLVFDAKKLDGVVAGLDQVIKLPDPNGRRLWRIALDDGLVLTRESCPLGVVGVIFESRPDVVVQVSGLLLKAGNAGILKGGREAQSTNLKLMETIHAGLNAAGTVPVDALQLVSTREDVKGLLDCDDAVDLLIPRGGNDLVKFIQQNTAIPVLGHADGICHVYIHAAADFPLAVKVAVDSKTDYPAVCNAAETILVDRGCAEALLPVLVKALVDKGVEIKACPETLAIVKAVISDGKPEAGVVPADETDWAAEYLDLVVSIKVVDDLKAAVAHINRYGSHHTDTIVTADNDAAETFCRFVDSAGVFVNASTRFADGFRYGLGAEIGISTNKIHARGPVGLEGIVTYKYKLRGNGQVAGEYGAGKKTYQHRVF